MKSLQIIPSMGLHAISAVNGLEAKKANLSPTPDRNGMLAGEGYAKPDLWLAWVVGKALVYDGYANYFINTSSLGVFHPQSPSMAETLYAIMGGSGETCEVASWEWFCGCWFCGGLFGAGSD